MATQLEKRDGDAPSRNPDVADEHTAGGQAFVRACVRGGAAINARSV
jgi:hypothetical protein